MKKVLEVVQRLRKHAENEARRELQEAEVQQLDEQRRLTSICSHIDSNRDGVDEIGLVELSSRHSWGLQLEVNRRRQEQVVLERRHGVAKQKQLVKAAHLETKMAERMVEIRTDELRREQAHHEMAELNEAGLQLWWRASR